MRIESFIRKVKDVIRKGQYSIDFMEAEGYKFLNKGAYASVFKLNNDEVVRIYDMGGDVEIQAQEYLKLQDSPQANVVNVKKVIMFDEDIYGVIMEKLDPIQDHYNIEKYGISEKVFSYFGDGMYKTEDYDKALSYTIDKI